MDVWLLNQTRSKMFPLFTIWYIWKECNYTLFEGKTPSALAVSLNTIATIREKERDNKPQVLRIKTINKLLGFDVAFFDGEVVARETMCRVGGTLKCINLPDYKWYINCGVGSNTKAELLGAWTSLLIECHLGIHQLHVMGDSKVIIDWLWTDEKLQAINIEGWKNKVQELQTAFQNLSFHHIFRESSEEANKLSKRVLVSPKGRLTFFYLGWRFRGAFPSLEHFLSICVSPIL
jgi:hypothetical protein